MRAAQHPLGLHSSQIVPGPLARARSTREVARLAQRLRRSHLSCRRQDDRTGGLDTCPPSGMDREWTRSPPRAQPASNRFSVQHQRATCAAILRRPFARRQHGPVRHAHRRHADDRPEMKREAGSARMVASGRVDHQDVGCSRQCRDRRLQQRALTQGKQARVVSGRDTAPHEGACDDASLDRDGRCRPAWLPLDTWRLRVAGKADEARSDRIRIRRRLPCRRLRQRQLALRSS